MRKEKGHSVLTEAEANSKTSSPVTSQCSVLVQQLPGVRFLPGGHGEKCRRRKDVGEGLGQAQVPTQKHPVCRKGS